MMLNIDKEEFESNGKIKFNMTEETKDIEIPYKFSEPQILEEVKNYIDSTYFEHYTSGNPDNVQAIELIASIGDGISFSRDNIIRYASRFGIKDGLSKKDALKIIHYGIYLYHYAFLYNR